jgi:hypothetical protein
MLIPHDCTYVSLYCTRRKPPSAVLKESQAASASGFKSSSEGMESKVVRTLAGSVKVGGAGQECGMKGTEDGNRYFERRNKELSDTKIEMRTRR